MKPTQAAARLASGLTLVGAAAALAAAGLPDLGPNASLRGRRPFPEADAWNTPVERAPADPASDRLIDSIGRGKRLHPDFGANWNGGPFGIPYVVVPGNQPRVPVRFAAYGDESDAGPYPIPLDAPIEGGPAARGDRHVLVLDRDNWRLYETFNTHREGSGFRADCGAVFDLRTNTRRPAGWTSADAAGLPIFPGLVRRDEVVELGEIRHALRFTAARTRRAYTAPASHFASRDGNPNLPPMGMRVRLKAGYDIGRLPPSARVVARALQVYGMILADNGSDWFISGAPDRRWNDEDVSALKRITGNDLEVVRMGPIVTR